MAVKGHRTDRGRGHHRTRAERMIDKIRTLAEECVWIDYAHDKRSLTGQICGDPMPEHRELAERLNYERKE